MTIQKEQAQISRDRAAQTLASLPPLAAAPLSAVVLVSQASSGQPAQISQLQPTNAAAVPLSGVIATATRAYVECELIDYEPSTTAVDQQVMWLPVTAVPLLEQVLAGSDDLANLERFDPRRHDVVNLRLAALRVSAGGSSAVYVQNLRGSQVVARSTKVGLILRRGVLDVPNGEILMLTSDVIAVLTGDYIFFRNRSAFQLLFGLMDELRQQAATTFAAVTAQLQIEGLQQMEAAVTGAPNMLAKMASIQRKLDQYPQYREALTMPKLVAFVEAHPECGVQLTGQGANTKLIFRNDPQTRFKILKLLDDDFLRSELTTLEYEANSKSFPLKEG